jgi:hypothetical protein
MHIYAMHIYAYHCGNAYIWHACILLLMHIYAYLCSAVGVLGVGCDTCYRIRVSSRWQRGRPTEVCGKGYPDAHSSDDSVVSVVRIVSSVVSVAASHGKG